MPLPVASLPPPTAPVQRFPDDPENEPIESGTMEFGELWQDKARGLTFADVLDIVNPLQHIPVVSTLYRAITGDGLGLGARLIGGALYGGGIGLALGAAQAAVEGATGRDIGANMVAFVQDLTGDDAADAPQAPDAAVAETETLSSVAPAAGPDPETQADAPATARNPLPAAPPPAAAPARPAADAIAGREFPARDEKPRPVVGSSPSEKARIAEAVERARRAQAAMLLANAVDPLPEIGADADAPDEKAKDAKPAAVSAAAPQAAQKPARAPVHPNMIPAGASPEWITQAMERALNKYEDTLRLRGR
ncbi:MAG: hypothetical protein GEU92_17570 [Alphaproteobacteria bacterium]|nr:hypothetical protein [Alphaproteobacteria bacterium]